MGKGLILLLPLLVGCVTQDRTGDELTAAGLIVTRQVWCDHNQPQRPTRAAISAMTRSDLDDLNAFNMKGASWCGWK